MKQYQQHLEKTRTSLKDIMESMRYPAWMLEELQEATTHQDFNDFAVIIYHDMKNHDMKNKLGVMFKKLELM